MVLDAVYQARTHSGAMTYQSEDFSTGIFETRLGVDELLVEIEVPIQPSGVSYGYHRFSLREGEYPMTVACCRLEWD